MTDLEPPGSEPVSWLDARDYPVLAAIWDNDDDAIFDTLDDEPGEDSAPAGCQATTLNQE